MAKTRRKYKGNATATTIAGGLGAGATSATLESSTGWATSGPFYAVVDPGLATEEKILVGSISGNIISSITRGVDDTSDQNHAAGCSIYPVFTAIDADEANELTSAYTTQGDIIYQGSVTFTRLGIGSADTVLKSASGVPAWGTVNTNGITDDAVTMAKIAPAAVGAVELNTNAAGSGLVGGAGDALAVNVDDSTIEISSDAVRLKDNGVTLAKLATAVANKLVPVGTIAMYGGASAPTGWLLCDGASIDAQYTALKAIVGNNTPDLKGRFAIGDNASLSLLGTGGSLKISEANLPSHKHTINHDHVAVTSTGMSANSTLGHSISDPGHSHASTATGYEIGSSNWSPSNLGQGINWGYDVGTASASTGISISDHSVAHTHDVDLGAFSGDSGNTGSGTDYYPPYLVVNYIIKHD